MSILVFVQAHCFKSKPKVMRGSDLHSESAVHFPFFQVNHEKMVQLELVSRHIQSKADQTSTLSRCRNNLFGVAKSTESAESFDKLLKTLLFYNQYVWIYIYLFIYCCPVFLYFCSPIHPFGLLDFHRI